MFPLSKNSSNNPTACSKIPIHAPCFYLFRKIVDGIIILVLTERKRCRIVHLPVDSPRLSRHSLNHHSNCHSTWETVRIENNIREQSARCPRDILARPLLAANTLLTGARRELVADTRVAL